MPERTRVYGGWPCYVRTAGVMSISAWLVQLLIRKLFRIAGLKSQQVFRCIQVLNRTTANVDQGNATNR